MLFVSVPGARAATVRRSVRLPRAFSERKNAIQNAPSSATSNPRTCESDTDKAELAIVGQLQRTQGKLLIRPVKTDASEVAASPMPDLCATALELHRHH